ncbi:MAG: hypothetical protein ACKOUR_08410 [Planctomycetota bacterium]
MRHAALLCSLPLLLSLIIAVPRPAAAQEKPAADTTVADKLQADKPAAEKSAAEKPATEKPAAEKPTAEKPAAASANFMRLRRGNDQNPVAVETAVTRFERLVDGQPALQVDLVSVIHIGEKSYYDSLNELFKKYDAVLYELVAPEGTRPPSASSGQKRVTSAHPVSAMQRTMQNMLALDFQLEQVDYARDNFIHADMTPEEMSKSMTERQESWMGMIFRSIGQSMAQQGIAQQSGDKKGQPANNGQLLMAFFAKDRALRLRRLAAQQFDDMDANMAALQGPNGSTLITERNKKALQVLDREIKNGKKQIAIFYGAGHMVDMAERLEKEFGLKRVGDQWLTAWSLEAKP